VRALALLPLLAALGCAAEPVYRPVDWVAEPGGWWLHRCGAFEVRATALAATDDGGFLMKLKNASDERVTLHGVNLAEDGAVVAAWEAGPRGVDPGGEIEFRPALKRRLDADEVDLHFRLEFGGRRQTCTMSFAR
jgi:hypothetical protein